MSNPDVLIVSYRAPDDLKTCLESVRHFAPGSKVKVWDNRSDRTQEVQLLAEANQDVEWKFSATNVGFAVAVNAMVASVESEFFLLLNPDARLVGPIAVMETTLTAKPKAAATAPWFEAPSPQKWDVAHRPYSLIRTLVSHAGYSGRLRNTVISDLYPSSPSGTVGYLTGACLMIRSASWADIGQFDERFFLYSEEVDWSSRARSRGWSIVLTPVVGVAHESHGTVSDSAREMSASVGFLRASQRLYILKHSTRFAAAIFSMGLGLMDKYQPSKKTTAVRATNEQ